MQRKFKVLHLSTSHKGGAGIAARRLNLELNRHGIDSSIYVIDKGDFFNLENEYSIKRNYLRRLLSLISAQIGKLTLNITFFSVFSSPGISNRWLKSVSQSNDLIVHIHNWFNLLSFTQLKRLVLSGVPVVITMHDQRLMTGGCHVTLDCANFQFGCKSCPKISNLFKPKVYFNAMKAKKFLSKPLPNLRIVAPSYFMIQMASRSSILRFQKLHFASNPIPSDFTNLLNANRRNIGDIFKVGVASADSGNPLKGGDLIEDLSHLLDENIDKIRLVHLSQFKSNLQGDFWNQINCLLVPSRGDNSPNVIHEAKTFGIPVIASGVGGIPELLFTGFDVELSQSDLNVKSILNAIMSLKNKSFDLESILAMQERHKNYMLNPTLKIIEIYNDLFEFRKIKL
jgi:glycosyltransferase involved in cell wall biosynthesis